ncbi:MAG: hypothetical protein COU27_02625 [Candidatus Levybacteria bacterium CG10_big_fil_rev_8_21_14_0_10_36_7]|nr:MAG: hypothetical protein COU27_02625 [Candidatus Levybacteria bacterium CG10_big_fil_rev_8_21_14_0_10_36_7]
MWQVIFGGIIGFSLFTLMSHPKSRLNKRLPNKKIKNVQFFPRVNFSARERVFHFHHWLLLTPIYLYVQNLVHSDIANGVFIGGILQGLMYKDRFKIIFKDKEYNEMVKGSGLHFPKKFPRFRKKKSI